MIPILVMPPLMLMILIALPFIESWITGDKRGAPPAPAPPQRRPGRRSWSR